MIINRDNIESSMTAETWLFRLLAFCLDNADLADIEQYVKELNKSNNNANIANFEQFYKEFNEKFGDKEDN